jgi:hypothetical protein
LGPQSATTRINRGALKKITKGKDAAIKKRKIKNSDWKTGVFLPRIPLQSRQKASCGHDLKSVATPALQAKNEASAMPRKNGNHLFTTAYIFAAICCSAVSLASELPLTEKVGSESNHVPRSTVEIEASHQYDKNAENKYIPKKEYDKLKREIDSLKAQVRSLVSKNLPLEKATKAAATTPKKNTESSAIRDQKVVSQTGAHASAGEGTQAGSLDIAEGNREKEAHESRRELDTFLRGKKVLFKSGELQLELNLVSAQDTTDRTPNVTTRSTSSTLLVRYGLADDLEFDLTIPYSHIEQETNFLPFVPPGNQKPVSRINGAGIGDISGALRYTAWHESGEIPSITLSLNAKSKTGKKTTFNENRVIQRPGLGSGFWNIGAAIALVKTIDPVVFFGSLGYTTILKKGDIDPGEQISYSLGTGFSMNDRVSFSTSLSGAIVGRTEINGQKIAGSSADINTLQFSSTIQLTKRLFVEPFVGIGLTEKASDFVIGFSVPYRFERRFPLPFFHD